jgi:hypothetical protein
LNNVSDLEIDFVEVLSVSMWYNIFLDSFTEFKYFLGKNDMDFTYYSEFDFEYIFDFLYYGLGEKKNWLRDIIYDDWGSLNIDTDGTESSYLQLWFNESLSINFIENLLNSEKDYNNYLNDIAEKVNVYNKKLTNLNSKKNNFKFINSIYDNIDNLKNYWENIKISKYINFNKNVTPTNFNKINILDNNKPITIYFNYDFWYKDFEQQKLLKKSNCRYIIEKYLNSKTLKDNKKLKIYSPINVYLNNLHLNDFSSKKVIKTNSYTKEFKKYINNNLYNKTRINSELNGVKNNILLFETNIDMENSHKQSLTKWINFYKLKKLKKILL